MAPQCISEIVLVWLLGHITIWSFWRTIHWGTICRRNIRYCGTCWPTRQRTFSFQWRSFPSRTTFGRTSIPKLLFIFHGALSVIVRLFLFMRTSDEQWQGIVSITGGRSSLRLAVIEDEGSLDGEDTIVVLLSVEEVPVYTVLPEMLDETHTALVEFTWKIDRFEINHVTLYNWFVTSSVPADGLAPWVSKKFAGTGMTKFTFQQLKDWNLQCLAWIHIISVHQYHICKCLGPDRCHISSKYYADFLIGK